MIKTGLPLEQLKVAILSSLENGKGQEICELDVRGMTDLTDMMIVVSGTSTTHVRALAGHLVDDLKKLGQRPLGWEGEEQGDWVLVDYGEVVVHLMHPDARLFYALEKLWGEEMRTLLEHQKIVQEQVEPDLIGQEVKS